MARHKRRVRPQHLVVLVAHGPSRAIRHVDLVQGQRLTLLYLEIFLASMFALAFATSSSSSSTGPKRRPPRPWPADPMANGEGATPAPAAPNDDNRARVGAGAPEPRADVGARVIASRAGGVARTPALRACGDARAPALRADGEDVAPASRAGGDDGAPALSAGGDARVLAAGLRSKGCEAVATPWSPTIDTGACLAADEFESPRAPVPDGGG